MNDEQFVEVGRALVELIELLEKPSPFTPTCTCGWKGREWDDEADATAECWSHAPCFGPYHGECSCGWQGPVRIEQAVAQADWESHLASHGDEP